MKEIWDEIWKGMDSELRRSLIWLGIILAIIIIGFFYVFVES